LSVSRLICATYINIIPPDKTLVLGQGTILYRSAPTRDSIP
jgi:hypothetical protein